MYLHMKFFLKNYIILMAIIYHASSVMTAMCLSEFTARVK